MKESQEIITSFNQFDLLLSESNEIGLVIAADDEELDVLAQILKNFNYKLACRVEDLILPAKLYMTIDSNMKKEIYDFVVQYPLGRIEFVDNNLQASVFSPDYSNQNITLLIRKNDLDKLNKTGFDLRSVTGPAFQI